MHLPHPLPTMTLLLALSTSALASSSAADTSFNFGTGRASSSSAADTSFNFGTGGASSSSAADTSFNFGTGGGEGASTSFAISTTVTILDGFTVTTSGYSIGKTPEPKGEWTLDIHPHNTECLFGTDSYTFSSSKSLCFPHGGKSLYFHNKYKPNCTATTFSGRNCRGSSIADLRSDLCNWITFGSVNVTCT